MENNNKLILEKIIKLTRISEKKYKNGDFKGAIDDKREARSILNKQTFEKELLDKYKTELSLLYSSKFDLIYDHKLRIDNSKKSKIIKLLEQKSEEKYNNGDYKAAIKALRRSEKYI